MDCAMYQLVVVLTGGKPRNCVPRRPNDGLRHGLDAMNPDFCCPVPEPECSTGGSGVSEW